MKYEDIKKLFIFNSFIFSIIIILGIIMLFRASFAVNVSDGSNASDVWDGHSMSSSLSGTGTENDPYLIQSANDLAYLADRCNREPSFAYTSKYINITDDIYINDGYFDYNDTSYNGIIYYKNHKKYYVKGDKYYDTPDWINEVGTLNQLPTISNLFANIYGSGGSLNGLFYYSNNSSKSFANYFCGNIESLEISNSVIIGNGNVGFINDLDGNLWGMSFSGYIKNTSTLDNKTTGFIGSTNGGNRNFDRIAVSGKIEANGGKVGGLVGDTARITMRDCYCRSIMSSVSGYVGGLVGYLWVDGSFDRSFRNSGIGGSATKGGLIGYVADNSNVDISCCMVVNGSSLTGQLIGRVDTLSSITWDVDESYYSYSDVAIKIGGYNNSDVPLSDFTYLEIADLLKRTKLHNIGYLEQDTGPAISGYIWRYKDNDIPTLSWDHYYSGTVKIKCSMIPSGSIEVTGGSPNSVQMVTSPGTFKVNLKNGTSPDANDINIGKVEYYIRDGEYKTDVVTPASSDYKHYDNDISIQRGDCRSIYVKVTDMWGNVSYGHSYVLWYDGYNISYSEGVGQAEYDSGIFSNVNSSSLHNIHVKHDVTKAASLSFPSYSSSLKQYLMLPSYVLPNNTVMTLTDYYTNNVYQYITSSSTPYTSYTSGPCTYKMFDLSNLVSIYDNTSYDNRVSSYKSTNDISENFMLTFKYPTLSNSYTFGPIGAGCYAGIVARTSPTASTSYSGMMRGTIVKDASSSRTIHTLTTSTDSVSFSSPGDTREISFQLSKQAAGDNTIDHNMVQDKYMIEAYITDSSNHTISSHFAKNNFDFAYVSGLTRKSFSFKNGDDAYLDFSPTFYGDTVTSKVANFQIIISQHNNNFLNMFPDNYKIKFLIKSNGSIVASKTIDIGFLDPISIDNYNFSGSIERNDRIINHTTGRTANNSSNVVFNYSYSYTNNSYNNSSTLGSSGNLLIKLYRYDVSNGNVNFTSINPSTLFSGTFVEYQGGYKTTQALCIPNSDCDHYFGLKNNIPVGRYVLEIVLYNINTEKSISRERFNLIVK